MKHQLDEKMIRLMGARIRELRKEKGYKSFESIAYEAGISRTQWGGYEKGKDLTFTSLIRVLRALNVDFDTFFDEAMNQTLLSDRD